LGWVEVVVLKGRRRVVVLLRCVRLVRELAPALEAVLRVVVRRVVLGAACEEPVLAAGAGESVLTAGSCGPVLIAGSRGPQLLVVDMSLYAFRFGLDGILSNTCL
jgi:hypothetical protein